MQYKRTSSGSVINRAIVNKHADCGGVSQNRDGSFECRAKEFIKENGAVSFKKPKNFKSPAYTENDVDSGRYSYLNINYN